MKCLKNGYRVETSRNRHFRFVWLSIFKKKKKEKKGTILHIRYCFMRFFFSTIHYMRLIRSYRIDSYRCELTAMYVHAHQTFVWINRSNLCIIFYMGIIKSKVYNMINWTSVYQETNLSSVLLVLLLVTTYLTSIDNF